jgi:hypothetical protein
MKEFMLLIRNQIDHQAEWSPERHEQFLKGCETYIGKLKKNNNLIAAKPMVREGELIAGTKDRWVITPFNENKEVIVGYYHIYAKDMEEAVSLAKENPEFEYSTTARIEVRPIKMKEIKTGFVYPS